ARSCRAFRDRDIRSNSAKHWSREVSRLISVHTDPAIGSFGFAISFWQIRGETRYLMAEREGFEPPVPFPAHLISSQAHSATLSPLRPGAGRKAACSVKSR